MLKEDVIAFFKANNQNQSDIAALLGISRAAVSAWGKVIPRQNALLLDRITGHRLTYNPALYGEESKATWAV